MDFENLCMLFTMKEPYYGIVLSSMQRVPSKKVSTLGVTRNGNCFQLIYNPDFVKQFNDSTVLELLKHEVLHIAFNHFTIWNGEDASDDSTMHLLRNIATDLEVNCYIDRNAMQKSAGGCWVEDFGFNRSEGAREYLRLLLAKRNKQKDESEVENKNPMTQGNGLGSDPDSKPNGKPQNSVSPSQLQQSGNALNSGDETHCQTAQSDNSKPNDTLAQELQSKSFDDHSKWPDETIMSEGEVEMLNSAVEDLLLAAEDEVAKSCGVIPAEMRVRLDKIKLKKNAKPVANWKRYLRRFLGNAYTEETRKSRYRESRRFEGMQGNRHNRSGRLLVGIDTSGSISMPEYREFFSQLKTILKVATVHIVECDADIAYEYDFTGNIHEEVHGGGGTSYVPVINKYLKERKNYDSLIYFTDGRCWVPDNTPKDMLWVISSGETDRMLKDFRKNGTPVVFIKSN